MIITIFSFSFLFSLSLSFCRTNVQTHTNAQTHTHTHTHLGTATITSETASEVQKQPNLGDKLSVQEFNMEGQKETQVKAEKTASFSEASKHDSQSMHATGRLYRTTTTTKSSPTEQPASKAPKEGKEQKEDTVLCRICQRNLAPSKFSNNKLKKFRKAQGKGKSMQIVCTSCTESNLGSKKGAKKPPTGKKSTAAKMEKPVTPRMAAMPT